MSSSIKSAAGAIDPAKVEHQLPMVRKSIDMVSRQVNEKSQKVQKALPVRRKLVRK